MQIPNWYSVQPVASVPSIQQYTRVVMKILFAPMPSAPPRALDEEDEQFFSALADSQNKRKQLRELEEEKEVASFRKHMQSSDSSAAPKFKLTHDKPVSVTAPAVPAPGMA